MRCAGGNASADLINDVTCEFSTFFKGFEVAPPQRPLAMAFKGVFFVALVGFRQYLLIRARTAGSTPGPVAPTAELCRGISTV